MLSGYANDAASVDRAVRSFIGANTNLFGAATLRTVRVNRTGDVWYVSYRQTLDGMDVLFSDWEFRVHASGKLMMFGADGHAPAKMPSRGGSDRRGGRARGGAHGRQSSTPRATTSSAAASCSCCPTRPRPGSSTASSPRPKSRPPIRRPIG